MDPRENQRQWLSDALRRRKMTPTALARRAGLSPSTLTRFLNSEEHSTALNARSMAAIETVLGEKQAEETVRAGTQSLEAQPFSPENEDDGFAELVAQAIGPASRLKAWILTSRALEAAGFLPDDVLIVDPAAKPDPGDVVQIQRRNWGTMTVETLFRIFDPPAIVTATLDRKLRKPMLLDDNVVKITGVVVASVRRRQGRPL
jgi:SOS-response transcriptional repressor LexA